MTQPRKVIQVDRGLELAKDYLRKIIVGVDFQRPSREEGFDLLAAIEWICHKQAAKDLRRKKGGKR